MKKLIIDCGATTCRFEVLENQAKILSGRTFGFSPTSNSIDDLVIFDIENNVPDQVYFYGSGFTEVFRGEAKSVLQNRYPLADIFIESDLRAAALATCGDTSGFVHIIGTGSAVNYWDGIKMTNPKVNLGYLWEDYASGYDITKTIISYWNDGLLETHEVKKLKEALGTIPEFLAKVYRSEDQKSLLAQSSRILSELEHDTQKKIINERLEMYFSKNIDIFAQVEKHHFVGSLAFFMQTQIKTKMSQRSKDLGFILPNTMEALCRYHMNKITKS